MNRSKLFLLSFLLIPTHFIMSAYTPDWESIDSRPTPSWYTDAKFGIFIHWGLYSIPAWGPIETESIYDKYAEWYWYKLLDEKSPVNALFSEFHKQHFGEHFQYQDFAQMFKAELFEPSEWARILKKSGAKYVVLTSKHHEGFCLWPSEQSWNWNAVDVGPHRDLAGELSNAVKDAGLHMGFYYSLYEWFNPVYHSDVDAYVENGTPIITVEHLGEFRIDHQDLPLVSDSDCLRLKNYRLNKNDIVFSRVGSVDRNALVRSSEEGWLFSGRLLRVRLLSSFACSRYLSYHFHSEPFKNRVREVAVGQTMASLNTRILKGILVVLPSKAEQEAIAEALSDTDALIDSLEQLIAKKRLIKQGTMQQLLTGKTRLPGFEVTPGFQQTEVGLIPNDWEVVPFSSICSMKSGCSITGESIDQTSDYPCYGGNGLRGFTNEYTHEGKFALVGRQGAHCGNVNLVSGRFFASEHAVVVTPSNESDISWLAFSLKEQNLNRLTESSAQPGLSVEKILKIQAVRPPTKAEQTAIAEVHSEMDAEIEALEHKLAKVRQLKQGMMQELLTGRIGLL